MVQVRLPPEGYYDNSYEWNQFINSVHSGHPKYFIQSALIESVWADTETVPTMIMTGPGPERDKKFGSPLYSERIQTILKGGHYFIWSKFESC